MGGRPSITSTCGKSLFSFLGHAGGFIRSSELLEVAGNLNDGAGVGIDCKEMKELEVMQRTKDGYDE